MKSAVKNLFFFLFLSLVLVVDRVFGIHAILVGVLTIFSLYVPEKKAIIFISVLGICHDAIYLLPLGLTPLILFLWIYSYPLLAKVLPWRWLTVALGVWLTSVALQFFNQGALTSVVWWQLLVSLLVGMLVYYSFTHGRSLEDRYE